MREERQQKRNVKERSERGDKRKEMGGGSHFESEEAITKREGKFARRFADSFVPEVKQEDISEDSFKKSGDEGRMAVALVQGVYYKVAHVADGNVGTGVYRQEAAAIGAVNSQQLFVYKVPRIWKS